jgi:radical SAM/Cys-rich protein
MSAPAARIAAASAEITAHGCAGEADFDAHLAAHGCRSLQRGYVTTLQLNVGKRCNLACHHCHVGAGPKRTESMQHRVAERVLELLADDPQVEVLDLTGGAPELNEQFRYLVAGARALGRRVTDRCNLTILFERGQEDTAEFLAAHEVEIVASLPCYSPDNVDRQRGRGVFEASIDALQHLNRLGYGLSGSRLRLDLVYNPLRATLPPPQAPLEAQYKHELRERHGIEFHQLLTIANMPIERFAHDLERQGRLAEYLSLLVNHFNPATLPGLMCRGLLSVGYDGHLYDCDFNQMLAIELPGRARTIFELDELRVLEGQKIATAGHCFGCTAGAGSSCGGSLA